MIDKALRFAALLPRQPMEAFERMVTAVQARWESRPSCGKYHTYTPSAALEMAARKLGTDLCEILREPQLLEIEQMVQARWTGLRLRGPFGAEHNGDVTVARLSYGLVRALCAEVVVETGVCYGVASAFILQALHRNGQGQLYSIDLPPLRRNADDFVGRLIPEGLKRRWTLHRGSSRRLLGPLLRATGPIDMFLHDSLHTFSNMTMEFGLAWKALRPGGVIVSDDVQSNGAFRQFAESVDPAFSLVFAEEGKEALCGVMVKRS